MNLEAPDAWSAPKVSVVIPAYNAERHLAATVNSVLAQKFRDWELVIVDDGSKDGTANIAGDFAVAGERIHLIRQTNAGVAAARNKGFSETAQSSEYLCFLDSDDLLEPDSLEVLIQALEESPEVVAAYGEARYIDQDGRPTDHPDIEKQISERCTIVDGRVQPCPDSASATFETLIVDNCIVTPGAVLIRRKAFEAVGLFDGSVSPCEDWDMWLRLSRLGELTRLIRPVIAYRRHTGSLSNDHERMWIASHRLRDKTAASPDNNRHHAAMIRLVDHYHAMIEYQYRVKWASESLRKGELIGAAKQIRHAIRARARSGFRAPALNSSSPMTAATERF